MKPKQDWLAKAVVWFMLTMIFVAGAVGLGQFAYLTLVLLPIR